VDLGFAEEQGGGLDWIMASKEPNLPKPTSGVRQISSRVQSRSEG